MSTSGSLLRASTATQTAHTTSPPASRPIVLIEPQLQTVASLTASRAAEMPTVISAAAAQLMRPGTRTGDSGTNRQVKTPAATITISGIQNSQCQLRCCRITPEPTIPNPPPTPRVADSSPMLPATFSRGNSSRTMPKASGKMPPAAPWSARPTITRQRVGNRCQQRADREDHEGPQQHAPLAVHVAQATQDRGPDRGRQQVGGQQPGHARLRGVQIVLDRRQRRITAALSTA